MTAVATSPKASTVKRMFTGSGLLVTLAVALTLFLIPQILTNSFPQLFLQRLFDSFTNGAAYAVTAISLVLIFKATTLINFAQANIGMFGAYFVFQFVTHNNWPVVAGIIVAMVLMAVGSAGIERVLVRPFDPNDHLPVVLITFGLASIFEAVAGGVWGLEFHAFESPFPSKPEDFISVAGARLRYDTIGTLVVMFLMIGFLFALLNKTKVGLAFRAVSSNVESARLVGVRTGRTLQFGWALAGALGALGASLVANKTQLEPAFMAKLVIFAFAAAVLGGLDSIGGSVIAAFVVAAIQSLVTGYAQNYGALGWLKSNFALVLAFVVILVVLLVKPNGLYGTKRIERV